MGRPQSLLPQLGAETGYVPAGRALQRRVTGQRACGLDQHIPSSQETRSSLGVSPVTRQQHSCFRSKTQKPAILQARTRLEPLLKEPCRSQGTVRLPDCQCKAELEDSSTFQIPDRQESC
jgi:hypothetical protein